MAKTVAPLLSFGGSGQIAKTQVYSTWRGIKYARRYVVPANPRSSAQTQTRTVFSFLNAVWKLLDPLAQAPFTAYAKGRSFLDRNAFISKNLSALRGTTGSPAMDLSGWIGSPGAGGGAAPAAIGTADATGHHVTVTLTAPAVPSGWTVNKAHAVALLQQEPDTADVVTTYYGDAVGPGFAIDINVHAAGTFAVVAWFDYTKPDGSTAYGPSLYAEQVIA